MAFSATTDLPLSPFDMQRELDKAKSKVFTSDNAAFLGSLMCTMEFVWSKDLETAATNGITFWCNPDFFMVLTFEARQSLILHELWHAARLHMLRIGSRDPEEWNWACDIRINNDLYSEGRTIDFGPVKPWFRPDMDQPEIMAEEDIYDLIKQQQIQMPPSWAGAGDLIEISPEETQQAVNNVVHAVQQAHIMGKPGDVPGDISNVLKKFLAPIVPWQVVLKQFFEDMLDEDYTWKKPNRRHQDIYLPSRFTDDGRLEQLNYYLDVSGSITDEDVLRFNSEVKYIKDTYNPVKLKLIQFDTGIRQVLEFDEDDPFDEVVVVGRGGTCLIEVRQHIIDDTPTAAVIFTDMGVAPMRELPFEIPIIWICVGNKGATVPFGTLLHI